MLGLELSFLALLFLVSLIVGFTASAPIGPVNLWAGQLLISRGRKYVQWFLLGVILVDLTYVFLGFWSYFFLTGDGYLPFGKTWEIIGGIFIMMIGLASLAKNQKKAKENKLYRQTHFQPLKVLFTGAALCASNAMLFIMWFFIAKTYAAYGLVSNTPLRLTIVLMGVLVGDVVWFSFFVRLVKKGLTKLRPININRLQKLIAVSLILFGLFTACRQL